MIWSTRVGGSNVTSPFNIRCRDYAAETLDELEAHEADPMRPPWCWCISCRILHELDRRTVRMP